VKPSPVKRPAVKTTPVKKPAVETPAVKTSAGDTPAVKTPAVKTSAGEATAVKPAVNGTVKRARIPPLLASHSSNIPRGDLRLSTEYIDAELRETAMKIYPLSAPPGRYDVNPI